jgi:hypothetical protein
MDTGLICLGHSEREAPTGQSWRPRADFVAQIIAASARLPQTRSRRRLEPDQAAAVYGSLGQRPTIQGQALSRSL